MPVNLNTFVSVANAAKADQSIFIRRDAVKAGTHLHRASTFRATTQQFIQLLGQEYGAHMGELAGELLKYDVEAGKPLKAAQVKAFIALGKEHAAKESVDRIMGSKQSMENFLRGLYGDDQLTLSDGDYSRLKPTYQRLQATLVASAHQKPDHAYDDLTAMMRKNQLPLARHATDLILGNVQSDLVRVGYPREKDPQLVADKLKVLSLIVPSDATRYDQTVLTKAMIAIDTIRQAKPAPAELNGADIFNALFPPALTPTMDRPSAEDLAFFTPAQMQKVLKQANDDALDHFKTDSLPPNSVFKGHDSSSDFCLSLAQMLGVLPDQLLNLEGDRVTLQDLPMLQAVNTISSYDSLQKAQEGVCKDMCRRGTVFTTATATPPTVAFIGKDGRRTEETVGGSKFLGDNLSPDQLSYNSGSRSTVTEGLFASIHAMSATPAQERVLTGALSQSGVYPLKNTIQALGDFMNITEHCKFDYSFQQNQDDSVDVTVTTGAELKGFNGTGRLTYHIEADGRAGITDFQWDKPTVDERREAMLHGDYHSNSIPVMLRGALERSHADLGGAGKDFFLRMGQAMFERKLAGATTHDELPSLGQLQSMMKMTPAETPRDSNAKIPVDDMFKPIEKSGRSLDRLLKICQSVPTYLRAVLLPPAQQPVFLESIMALDLEENTICLDKLMSSMDELAAASQNGPLTPEVIWPILYGEPLPAEAGFGANGTYVGMEPLMNTKHGDAIMATCQAKARELGLPPDKLSDKIDEMYGQSIALTFSGIPENVAWDIISGNPPTELNLADISATSGFVYTKSLHDLDMAAADISKDLFRMGNQKLVDLSGALPSSQAPGWISIDLPTGAGQPQAAYVFNPRQPEGLQGEELAKYRGEDPDNAVMREMRSRIADFCGEDHPEQACGTLMALGQGGQSFAKTLSSVFNVSPSEHEEMKIIVTHDDQHQVHVRYENVDDCPLQFHWEFVISPTGRQTLEDFHMQRADV